MSLNTEQMADTPLALWREADGVDHSGNGLNLTPFGGGVTAGTSLDLSDANPSITLADGSNLWNPGLSASFDLSTAMSLSFLFRPSAVGGADLDLVRKNWLYGAYLGTAGKVHATLTEAGSGIYDFAGATTIVAGTTYHVGVSYDGTTLRLYVNGALDGSVVAAGTISVDNAKSITIGTTGIAGFDGIAGQVDEVALYNHVLTAGRFAAHHTASITAGSTVLWVDADNAGASDAGDRAAAMNPSTPLEIRFLPAAAADPTNTSDPSVYAPIYSGVYGFTMLSLAPGVTVEGVTVGGVRPKWLGVHATGLVDWTVKGYQCGYDLGSGFEYQTNCTLIGGSGFVCQNVIFTGGAYQLLGVKGAAFEDCAVTAKVSATPASYLEGNGFRVGTYTGYTLDPGDQFIWRRVVFDTVQGEDAIQLFVSGTDGGGQVIIEDTAFDNIVQDGEFHTDAIQSLGCSLLRVARSKFGYTSLVSSMIIASDGYTERLELENNLFVGRPGSGFLTQFSGVASWLIRHNTWVNSGFAGLRFYVHDNARDTYDGVIHSNVIDNFQVNIPTSGAGVTWEQHHNVIGIGYATVDDYNVFSEFGTSPDTEWELANSGGILSPGIDQAWAADPDALVLDRLGRAREGAGPDCGCHESSLTRGVVADPRAPIVVSFSPANGATGVSRTVSPSVELFPKPGETLDAATVTSSSVTLVDLDGHAIPVSGITVGALDGSGHQTVTLDPAGTLWQRVSYTFAITTAIHDTEGSPAGAAGVTWRTTGGSGPAIDTGGGGAASGWTVGALT
jgi:hypothetical protein